MASQRVFQLGLRRAAAPSFKIQPAGRTIQKRYVFSNLSAQLPKMPSVESYSRMLQRE
jgi:succinate dehydrogenase (ubiquinone) cytochrome b560 subunit